MSSEAPSADSSGANPKPQEQKSEAQKQKERMEAMFREQEAKLKKAFEQQQQLAAKKKDTTVKVRALDEEPSSSSNNTNSSNDPKCGDKRKAADDLSSAFEVAATGNKRIDSKAAKQLVKQHKEQLFSAMGIMGFGKEGKDAGLPAGTRLKPPNWAEEVLLPFTRVFYNETDEVHSRDPRPFRDKYEISVTGVYVPNPLISFAEAGFPMEVMAMLEKAGFADPTPIQAQSWPIVLSGHNLIGLAETGFFFSPPPKPVFHFSWSGKTLAYLLPALVHIHAQPELKGEDGPIALVLAPTRELAIQIQGEADRFGDRFGTRNACLYGGVDKAPQKRQLHNGAELCIACPGRLLDFLEAGATNLKRVTYLVLDEADRMLEMGFEPQVRKICELVRPDRQTLFWSATWPRQVRSLADEFVKNPVTVQVGKLNSANTNIKQTVICLTEDFKRNRLYQLLTSIAETATDPDYRILIFCLTKARCENLWMALERREPGRAMTLHGERDHVMSEFRSGNCNTVIATDVAARGLDIKEIKYVINYDMPQQIEEYVHRIGRTGRAGDQGFAYSFMAPENANLGRGLIKLLQDARQEVPRDLEDLISGRGKFSPAVLMRGGGGGSWRGGGGRGGRGGDRYRDRDNQSSWSPTDGGGAGGYDMGFPMGDAAWYGSAGSGGGPAPGGAGQQGYY